MDLQLALRAQRQAGRIADVLLLLEHPPVYTRGRRTERSELPLGEDRYRELGIEIVDADRGGRVTYHGPGQLVGYPIMGIRDVGGYLRTMEASIAAALADEGIQAGTISGLTGVWTRERKIASIGVHVARGVTTHGFAVNVSNNLEPFEWILPCGLADVRMTSVAREGDGTSGLDCFRRRMAWHFCQAHGARQRVVSAHRVGAT